MAETEKYSLFTTEQKNTKSADIDKMTSREIVGLINAEDKTVAGAVEKTLDFVAQAVDATAKRLSDGGRLFYVGAGTSGRLAVVDAAECPPTYGTSPELVRAIMAGGESAMFIAGEGNEDDPDESVNAMKKASFCEKDVCFGISASGSAAFVQSALRYAHSLGAVTIAYSCHEKSTIAAIADIAIVPVVGPEVINGSTRMKAATAQKMVLTMYSTAVMVRLGRVKGNLMVHMKPTNKKLVERAVRIVADAAGCSPEKAREALEKCSMDISEAIGLLNA